MWLSGLLSILDGGNHGTLLDILGGKLMRLRELRKSKGLTQSQLAEKVGYGSDTVGKWERGDREPSTSSLINLADIINCSVDYLLERTDKR